MLSNREKWQQMLAIISQSSLAQTNLTIPYQRLQISRLISENILAFLLQYMGLMLSIITPTTSPIWIASGTACGLIFLRGPSILFGITLGSFIAYYLTKLPILSVLMCSLILLLQPLVIYMLCQRYITPTLLFYRVHQFVKFVSVIMIISAISSFSLITLCYPMLSGYSLLQHGLIGWLANLNGILIFACTLVTWDAYSPQIGSLKQYLSIRILCLYSILLILIFILLFTKNLLLMGLLMMAILPLLLSTMIQFGWCGASSSVFMLGLLLTLGSYIETPLFATYSSRTFILLEVFLIIETMVVYLAAIRKQSIDAA